MLRGVLLRYDGQTVRWRHLRALQSSQLTATRACVRYRVLGADRVDAARGEGSDLREIAGDLRLRRNELFARA
jgi:hypothetical protein